MCVHARVCAGVLRVLLPPEGVALGQYGANSGIYRAGYCNLFDVQYCVKFGGNTNYEAYVKEAAGTTWFTACFKTTRPT